MKNCFYLICWALLLASCKTYLPHTGFEIQNSPIVTPIYRGSDTSAVGLKASYVNTDVYHEQNIFDSVVDYPSTKLYSFSLDVSWAKTHEYFHYGAGAFAYGGQYIVKNDYSKHTKSYMGVGAKTMVGAVVHGRNVSWQIITAQASAAYDLGDYSDYRSTFNNDRDIYQFRDLNIVPGEVVTTSLVLSTQVVIGTKGDFSGGAYIGYVFNGYWYQKKYESYGQGLRVGPNVRYKGTQLWLTAALSNYSGGTVQVGISQLF